MKIYNGNNLVGEVKELTKENFNRYFSMNFTEYKNNCGYNIGDYVVYKGKLYKCIKAITVSEEFNPSKWEKVYGLNNISSLKIENDKLYITFEDGERKEIKNFSLTNALNQQVEYGQFGFNNSIEQISTLDTLIPFKTKVGNIDLNSDGTITLKANKTYKLSCYFRITDTDALKSLSVKQNETFLFNVVAKASEITETCTSVYIFTPTVDAKVGLYTPSYDTQLPALTSSAFYSNTKLIVQEIAQPVINNINYTLDDINNQTNIEDTPIGHIISFMGTKAPDHYLICDGSEYNIADYQKLADFFKEQLDSYNYFGGDGITTFALPNMGSHSEEDKWTADGEYIFSEAGAFCNIGGRTYYKYNVGKAIVAVVQSSDNTIYPMIVSTNPEYVKCYCSYDTSVVDSYLPDTIEYKGFTWYIGRVTYGWNGIKNNSGFAQKVISKFPYKEYTNIAKELLDIAKVKKVSVETKCIKYENTYCVNVTNNNTYKETILYKNNISLTGTLDNLDTTKYATTDTPMELTFNEDLSQYDRLEIVLGNVTYFGNNYWIPMVDKVEGKGNENIYYRNCLMVARNSYCSVQLDYFHTDKKITLLNNDMSTSDIKGATILKVIGIKY